MTGRSPNAYPLYLGGPQGDPTRSEQAEDAFFSRIRTRNGTTKLTYRRRLGDLNELLRPLLPADRPLEIMDVAVSSGVSTAEWCDSLESAGIEYRMVAGDAVLDAFLICAGSGVRALADRSGFLMHLELAGRAVGLPPPSRRCGMRLHLHLLGALRAAGGPLLRAVTRRVLRSPAWAQRLNVSCRPVQLVSPSLTAHRSVEVIEDDILRDSRCRGRFHVVRAANILNRSYFDDPTLTRMAINLRERLRPFGLLAVGRTTPEGRNHATVFRLERDGRFTAVARLHRGSEIADLLLALPPGFRSAPSTGAAVARCDRGPTAAR